MREPEISFRESPDSTDIFMSARIPRDPVALGSTASIAMLSEIISEFAHRYVAENYEAILAKVDMEAVAKMVGAAIIQRAADRITLTLKEEKK